MRLETDLAVIMKTAKTKDDENWSFRSFLKVYAGPTKEIDDIVHNLYQKISSEIDCKQCANCCRKMKPRLNQKDIHEFARGMARDVNEFKDQYLIRDDEEADKFRFKSQPCPFLEGNLCLNYEHRPQDCRSFPHLDKPGFVSRLWGVVENYAICPLVFNVYENLKKELGYKIP